MKKISVEIIADSFNLETGDRITTFILTFPRFILAELNTHRVFSRNSASSRAIPFKKMVEMVKEDPFIPIAWQKDHKGMQGTEYFDSFSIKENEFDQIWLNARDRALEESQHLSNSGVTKQLCNRLLEPFMWHTAIVTATEFENFFKQRCPQYIGKGGTSFRSRKDCKKSGNNFSNTTITDWLYSNKGQGEIHIMELAEQMWDAMSESTPKKLKKGEWHIPFGDKFDEEKLNHLVTRTAHKLGGSYIFDRDFKKIKIATARCARVSYLNFEGKDDYEADIKLHDRLAKMRHWSPFEHCAIAINPPPKTNKTGNFKGFLQYRKNFQEESGN